MKISGAKSLPVAMYHYVNDLPGGITVSPACFEEHCLALAKKGWRGVGLDEAEEYFIQGKPLPKRSILLTFDDGYLDNYLNAMPLLRAYGHKGVVFSVSNRMDADSRPRITLEDVLERKCPVLAEVSIPVVQTQEGFSVRQDIFFNHAEARNMDVEGTLRIASHTRGHYGVCIGPEFTSFFQPRTRYRTFYRTEDEPVWGMPDFTVKAGLLHRAFLPNPEMLQSIRKLVPQEFSAAAAFFAKKDAGKELKALVASYSDNMGRYETDNERLERMWREIKGGKDELENVLGHTVKTLCWPWGQYCDEAMRLALDAGFELFFTTKEGVNPPGSPLAVGRFKAKPKTGAWLVSRARIYSHPLVGKLYTKFRI